MDLVEIEISSFAVVFLLSKLLKLNVFHEIYVYDFSAANKIPFSGMVLKLTHTKKGIFLCVHNMPMMSEVKGLKIPLSSKT